MILQKEARLAEGAAGLGECSCLGGENGSDHIVPRPKNQPPCSPAAGIRLGMIRELFAESITLALGFGLNSLHAAQQGDDAAVIGEFRCFRAAARTAGECARDLREILGESRT
jgi:hypothetical protein